MADAILRHGEPESIVPHTPASGDLAAGQVVVLGNTTGLGCAIAAVPIANNVLGSLSIGGVWEVVANANLANNAKVYWEDSTNKVTTTSTNNSLFGYIVDRQSAAGDTTNTLIKVRHFPWQ